MEREVKIQRQVVETETLTICDSCGREVDPDGSTYTETGTESSRSIDLCSECQDDIGSVGQDDERVLRVEEWLQERDGTGDTMQKNVRVSILAASLAVSTSFLSQFVRVSSQGLSSILILVSVVSVMTFLAYVMPLYSHASKIDS